MPDRHLVESDLLSFARATLVLLEDGIRQSRAAGHILADIIAAAMARPVISEELHRAIVEAAENRSAGK
jgi:hypothetical protein